MGVPRRYDNLRSGLRFQGILRRNGCRAKRMDIWQRAVDTERFNPAFRSDEWRSRITDGHPERVVLTYVGRLGAGARPHCASLRQQNGQPQTINAAINMQQLACLQYNRQRK